ncbi:cytochrome c oxidase subunit 3 [Microvirga pakistanensis]|uniref:cytochrome c oxidase subunit 3 n=1 Tax=Microvirga pakistanensis TaxID=1682650 RepID=UPI00106A69B4|nr:cytochrome c oxidase subunit 3 [Microvirga pakistanensis]
MKHRPVQDVSSLPDLAFGPRMTTWWGTLGFCAVEGAGFAMAIGAYLYLVFINGQWPLSAPPPDLLWSGVFTLLLLASLWPNHLAGKGAKAQDLPKVRRTLVIMSLSGVALLGIRVFEFYGLHVRWDQNAYGSIVWLLLGLHTLHVLTDLGDTIVLTVLMFTRHGRGKRFSDVEDNAFYWNFVVITWLPIYVLLYWLPRM